MKAKDFNNLYKESKLIASYLLDLDKNKPEVIPGSKELANQFLKIIDVTFEKSDARGMKILNKDLREMASCLKSHELVELKIRFNENGFEF